MRWLNDAAVERYIGRLHRISPDDTGRWGTLTPIEMIAHLGRTFEISLGECDVPDASNAMTRSAPVRWLVIHVLPWPRGKIKAPAAMTPPPTGSFETERDRCEQCIRRFVAAARATPSRRTRNALFGPMTLPQWAKMHTRHLNHHFAQFGV